MLLLNFFVFNFGVKKLKGGGARFPAPPLCWQIWDERESWSMFSASDKGGYWGCEKTRSLRKRISRVLSTIKYLFYWSFYFFYFNLFHFTFILKSPIGTNKDVYILMDLSLLGNRSTIKRYALWNFNCFSLQVFFFDWSYLQYNQETARYKQNLSSVAFRD